MSDFIEISHHVRPSANTATSWFDAINRNPQSQSRITTTITTNNNSISTGRTTAMSGLSQPSATSSAAAAPIVNDAPCGTEILNSASPMRIPETLEFTPSTIRFNEDSGGSPRAIFSISNNSLPLDNDNNDNDNDVVDQQNYYNSHGSSTNPPAREISQQASGPLFKNNTTQPSSRPRTRHEDLYEDAMRAQLAKKQWAAVEQMRQSMLEAARVKRDCPFRPRLSSFAAKIQRPMELAPQNRIYDELIKKKEWCARKKREQIEHELEGCTFRPLTVRAATLKSSALVHDSGIFSDLYHHHEEQKHFREEVQPFVVQQLERHMLYKNPSNTILTENKLNKVVERLFSRGTVLKQEEEEEGENKRKRSQSVPLKASKESTKPTFKPVLSPESERITARQRESGMVSDDVVERLLNPSIAQQIYQNQRPCCQEEEKRVEAEEQLLRSLYNRELRALLHRERRKTFFSAKFDILSNAINLLIQERQGYQQRPIIEFEVNDIERAAIILLSPSEAEEVHEIISKSGLTKINKENFINLCVEAVEKLPNPGLSPLGRLPPPKLPSSISITSNINNTSSLHINSSNSNEGSKRQIIFHREIPSPEVLEEVRARREERKRREAEEAEEKRRAKEEEERRECTFHPPPRRKIPNECRVDYNVEVKTTKAEELRRAHIQKILNADENNGPTDLPLPSTKDLFSEIMVSNSVPSDSKIKLSKNQTQIQTKKQLLQSDNLGISSFSPTQQIRTKPALASANIVGDFSPSAKTPPPKRKKYEAKPHTTSTWKEENIFNKERGVANTSDVSSEGAAMNSSPASYVQSHAHAAAVTTAMQPRVYRDVVSEHAAFGRDGALTEFGRELILKQLREYRQRRRH